MSGQVDCFRFGDKTSILSSQLLWLFVAAMDRVMRFPCTLYFVRYSVLVVYVC